MKLFFNFGRALCVLAAFAMAGSATAEPVTLAFEAEVNTVFPGIPFDSGIDVAEGDIISGQFTFEPADGDGGRFFKATQPFDFSLNINGAALSAPNFDVEAINDGPVFDHPTVDVIDSLTLTGVGLAPVEPSMFPNIDPTSGFRMQLWAPIGLVPGESDALETAMIPGDADTWNRFTLVRNLVVTLADGRGGVMGFAANVGPFTQIPEPSAVALVVVAATLAFTCRISRVVADFDDMLPIYGGSA